MSAQEKKTLSDYWIDITKEFVAEHGEAQYTIDDVVVWAKQTGRWEPNPSKITKIGHGELRSALRASQKIDPHGVHVRRFISMKVGQRDLWCELHDAPHDLVVEHVRQQQTRIEADMQSLETFVKSYNTHYLPAGNEPIQLTLFETV